MVIVGHRGARGEKPENTVAGFTHAQSNGINYFELDIQLSKDNKLVVIHDGTLKRTTGVRKKVRDLKHHQLANLDARRNTPGHTHFCGVPSLEEVILSSPHAIHWQFEVKTDSHQRLALVAAKVTGLIRQYEMRDKVTITSSDRWFLQHLNENYQNFSSGYVAEYPFPDPIRTALKLGCDYVIPYFKLCTKEMVEQAHQSGLSISCWTVNRIVDMERLLDIGVDSVITDYPTSAGRYFKI